MHAAGLCTTEDWHLQVHRVPVLTWLYERRHTILSKIYKTKRRSSARNGSGLKMQRRRRGRWWWAPSLFRGRQVGVSGWDGGAGKFKLSIGPLDLASDSTGARREINAWNWMTGLGELQSVCSRQRAGEKCRPEMSIRKTGCKWQSSAMKRRRSDEKACGNWARGRCWRRSQRGRVVPG